MLARAANTAAMKKAKDNERTIWAGAYASHASVVVSSSEAGRRSNHSFSASKIAAKNKIADTENRITVVVRIVVSFIYCRPLIFGQTRYLRLSLRTNIYSTEESRSISLGQR